VNRSGIVNIALLCCMAAWAPTVARASLIDGSQLNISGNFQTDTISFTWLCNHPSDSACTVPPAGTGDFTVAGSTGSFAEYNSTFGLIKDINNAAQPLNAPFSLPNFLTFDLNNDLTVELTFIPLGTDALSTTCAGLSNCTPQNGLLITPSNPSGSSAFNLDQNSVGTVLTFGVLGVVHQAGGATASLSGLYNVEFEGMNPQQALAATGSSHTYGAGLSLTVTQTTPEPTSIFLSGIGLVGLGLFSRARRS
jgi:PEP-CTERM motif-containing protein